MYVAVFLLVLSALSVASTVKVPLPGVLVDITLPVACEPTHELTPERESVHLKLAESAKPCA